MAPAAEVRLWFSHAVDLGPGRRAVRRIAFYLRHFGFVGDISADSGASELRGGDLPGRESSARAVKSNPVRRPVAGGDTFGGLRSVGDIRARANVAKSRISKAAILSRVSSPIPGKPEWTWTSDRRAYPFYNGPSNHHSRDHRCPSRRARPAARGVISARIDKVG